MKTALKHQNGVSDEVVALVSRLVKMIPWPARRLAMGDATLGLLDGKERVAEDVFGWGREAVALGMNELRTGITCQNDLSTRHKPSTEVRLPQLLVDINELMAPYSQAEPRLRTTLSYTNVTASAVRDALLEKGWTEGELPTVRTISNILNRNEYRLRTVEKTKVQKKRPGRTKYSKMCVK